MSDGASDAGDRARGEARAVEARGEFGRVGIEDATSRDRADLVFRVRESLKVTGGHEIYAHLKAKNGDDRFLFQVTAEQARGIAGFFVAAAEEADRKDREKYGASPVATTKTKAGSRFLNTRLMLDRLWRDRRPYESARVSDLTAIIGALVEEIEALELERLALRT